MDVEKEVDYWSKQLNIPKNQFCKPYIKKSSMLQISHKRNFSHGTCQLRFFNAKLL
jgi:hypothetical protein